MKKKKLCIMLSLVTLISISSSTVFASTNSSFDSNTVAIKERQSVRYLDTIFNDFKLTKDIQFTEGINYAGVNEKSLLDVYTPSNDTNEKRPVIIWIHGGGLSYGNKDEQNTFDTMYSKEFAKKGYVSVNMNYRLTPNIDSGETWNKTMKNAMEDVVACIKWVRANSEEYGINKNKIILAGYSAGAELALNLVYGNYVDGWDRNGISSVVSISGSDLVWGDARKDAPPCTIIHGTADNVNTFEKIQHLARQLAASNIKYELNTFEGKNHQYTTGVEDWSGAKTIEKETVDNIEDIICKSLYKVVGQDDQALWGDVNGDGEITISDCISLKRHILNSDYKINEKNADINGDGNIDISDLLDLYDLV
jgi:acetyl esterase/lipase